MFKIKLHDIKKKELPEIDDEFVKDVSEFDTLDAYKADLKDKLQKNKTKEVENDVENQIIDKLVELVQADIPEAMYRNRINEDIREFGYRLQSQGLDLDTYMKYTGMDMDGFREGFRPQAERQVKIRLALEKIAELENIIPTAEDLEGQYNKLAESYKMDVEKVKDLIPEADLSRDIKVEKAIGLVHDSAVIK